MENFGIIVCFVLIYLLGMGSGSLITNADEDNSGETGLFVFMLTMIAIVIAGVLWAHFVPVVETIPTNMDL